MTASEAVHAKPQSFDVLMKAYRSAILIAFLALGFTGCVAPQRYRPAPISAAATAMSLERRSLDDPGLKQFVEKNLGRPIDPWPPKVWNLRTLTLAAFYFSPALEEARARLDAAEAAVVTAGAHPNPVLSFQPGVPSPWLLGLDLAVPIETAGKREYRLQEARSLSDVARLDLAETAWKVRSGVRAALVEHFLALGQLDVLQLEEAARAVQVTLLAERLKVGEVARPDLDAARAALLDTRVQLRAAEGQLSESCTVLAAAMGIPASTLGGIELRWPGFNRPPDEASLSPARIQRDAVLNRLDVRRSLAEYAATEAALQLEIAKQHPDFDIGPGYQFEESDNFFTLALSTVLPIRNRNQGPIAEAEAHRREAAASFLAAQAQVIAQSEQALTAYRAALRQLAEIDRTAGVLQTTRERMTRQAVSAGESDRLALNAVLLERPALAQARLAALGRAQQALGALEDAVERPLEVHDIAPVGPGFPALNEPGKEAQP